MLEKMEQICCKIYNMLKKISFFLGLQGEGQYKKILKKNRELKNKYKGKRCFVIGNGPSLRKQDLSNLNKEYVFTVNEFMRSDEYEKVKTNFHVFADPFYFNVNEDTEIGKEVIDKIKKINTKDNKPVVFFPAFGYANCVNQGLDKILNLSYFFGGLKWHEHYKDEIRYDKIVSAGQTVVHQAISLAIYMGFEEIILIGCDMTGYKDIEFLENEQTKLDTHAYKLEDNYAKRVKNSFERVKMEGMFSGFAKMFIGYRRLYEYCNARNVRLVNATAGGILDCIPRVDYKDLFVEK